MALGVDEVEGSLAQKGEAPAEHLVEDDAEAIEIAARIEGLEARLLWRHIPGRAEGDPPRGNR